MASISYAEPELLIALDKKVIFVNPNDLQIFKEVELPQDLTKCGLKAPSCDGIEQDAAEDEEKAKKHRTNAPQKEPSIQHAALAPNRQLLAITTAEQKAVLLYSCRPEHAKLLSVRMLARASSALIFSSDSKLLLVTDKTGDCYQYDCENVEAAPKLLLGHLSIVYDVLWTHDMKHIITCDRDDKVRVNNYPETFEIHGYCLGHKEFVAGMALLSGNVLVTVSGDQTMRLWNYMTGKELVRMVLRAPGIRLKVRGPLADGKYEAAVLLHHPTESVGIYELTPPLETDEEKWTIKGSKLESYPNMIVTNLCFVDDRLCVVGSDNEHFRLRMTTAAQVPENWLEMVEEQFKEVAYKPDDVSAWFKKRYDNVTDYLERKKRRIEEQNN